MSAVGALVALDSTLLELVIFDELTECAVAPQDRLRAVTTSCWLVVGGRAVDFRNDEAFFRPRATLRGCIGLFGQPILPLLRRRLFVDCGEWGAGSIVPAALMKRCQAVVGFYLPQIMTRDLPRACGRSPAGSPPGTSSSPSAPTTRWRRPPRPTKPSKAARPPARSSSIPEARKAPRRETALAPSSPTTEN